MKGKTGCQRGNGSRLSKNSDGRSWESVGKASARNRRLLVELLTDYYPLGGISKLKEYR